MNFKDYLNEKTDPKRVIEQIARDELGFATLKSRGSDKDFNDVSVDQVRVALTLAFEAGKKFNREKK